MRRVLVLVVTVGALAGLALPASASQPIITHSGPVEAVIPFRSLCDGPTDLWSSCPSCSRPFSLPS